MNAIENTDAEATRLAKLWDWIREKWIGFRLEYGSVTAEELKGYGQLGAKALVKNIMAQGGKTAEVDTIKLAKALNYDPNIAIALGFVALNADWVRKRIAVRVFGEGGNDAVAAAQLVDVLQGLGKKENAAILRGEAPDKKELALQQMVINSLGMVKERLSFRDYVALATAEKKEQRMWALRNLNPFRLSEEEVETLRGLGRILKKMQHDSREELGQLRRLISTWEADGSVMGKVKDPQNGKPEPPKRAERECKKART